jgi:phosphate-selective porin OprO/OprP
MGQVSDDTHRSEHWSVTTRATYAPIARRKLVLHLGGAAEYRDVLGGSDYRIATSPESSLGPRILSTGGLPDVDSVVSAGAEAAALFGPVLIQGEYQRSFLQRETGGDVDLGGGYVQASWVVTGEPREYSRRTGTFGSLEPRSDWGAVELAGRYSVLDLNDADVTGGEAENWTVGANWYVRRNLRFMFNYVRVNAKQRNTDAADDPQIFQFRAQLFF